MKKEEDYFSDSDLYRAVEEFEFELESADYMLKRYRASEISDDGSLGNGISDR